MATFQITAQPTRIAAGGIVLIVVEPPEEGDFDAEWWVEGPVRISGRDANIALLGTTTLQGGRVHLVEDGDGNLPTIRATLDTTSLIAGAWQVGLRLTRAVLEVVDVDLPGPKDTVEVVEVVERELETYEIISEPIEVYQRPFASGDDVSVTMKRTAVPATSDQALWAAIRNSTNALSFDNYSNFMDLVVCGDRSDHRFDDGGRLNVNQARRELREVERRTALPFPNVDRYRLLKAATEVFLMIHCGVDLDEFRHLDVAAESRRFNRAISTGDVQAQWREYLTRVHIDHHGGHLDVLPYLGLIRLKLRDISIVGSGDEDEAAEACYGILADKLAKPCFLELIWSYWHEEGMLVQALNAITWRFQNRVNRHGGRDPLAALEIDPLRPLNNLLWGMIQDEQHRLSVVRRAYEYDHHYGLTLIGRAVPPVRGADSRSRFIEAFHNLLRLCAVFYERDDDTTVIADGFTVLNGLKETHLLLTQGAHNQYGDLPWTARHEMLMQQWILARPEMRDFLPTRTMVAYPEPWMDRVEAMNKLQGWTDASVLHYRDLGIFGEQLLLGIRYGAWTTVIEPEQAANWARYWRPEVQGYIHAYRAVTGMDLTSRSDAASPAYHLRRRMATQRGTR